VSGVNETTKNNKTAVEARLQEELQNKVPCESTPGPESSPGKIGASTAVPGQKAKSKPAKEKGEMGAFLFSGIKLR
jgi:hypothetical protein